MSKPMEVYFYSKEKGGGKRYYWDVRPGDIVRIQKKVCCGNVPGTYSLLYKIIQVRPMVDYSGVTSYADCYVERLDQHARGHQRWITAQYLGRGQLVKRVHSERVAHVPFMRRVG